MPNFNVFIKIQGNDYSLFPGKVIGKDLYSLAGISESEHLLYLDVLDEVDVPIFSDNFFFIRGGENFVISLKSDDLPRNPVLRTPIDFTFNGKPYNGLNGFTKSKISLHELASLVNVATTEERFILDLDNLTDIALPDQQMFVVSRNWKIITTPIQSECDVVDLEECSGDIHSPSNAHRYRIRINKNKYILDIPKILGRDLLKLVDINDSDLFILHQQYKDGTTKVIDSCEKVNLTHPGIESFFTSHIEFKIIVNGRQKEVQNKIISFLDIVKLAFEDAVLNEITIYTVTYKGGPSSNPEGEIFNGECVYLKNRMVFNVTATDKS